jgi:hypothetical protein
MKLRIVLLLDSLEVSAWVWEAIFQVSKVSDAQIVLAVINQNPIPSGKKSPFFYRVYRFLDRKLFLNQPDAFEKKDLRTLPGWVVEEFNLSPIQKKYSDYFKKEDLERISEYQPDLILRFGFRILRGDILTLSKLGVWSYHHGDICSYRGGPPCFWEVFQKSETTGVVLQQLNEKLDDGLVLYQSRLQTDPLSVQRNANKVFWTSSSFVARVLKKNALLGLDSWKESLQELQLPQKPKSLIYTPPKSLKMGIIWANLWTRNAYRKFRESFQKPYWELTVSERKGESLLPDKFQTLQAEDGCAGKGSYWADPFPVIYQGETWVFYEEYDSHSKKGKIGVGNWNGKKLQACKPVLEENWHLSYPFIWEENGDFWMIPESGEAHKLYLYQATEFPYQWKKIRVFFDGEGYDPTILKKDGKYWLFINQKSHPGASPFVELFLYSSPSLENPIWTPHALNPIVSDVHSSRPAGRIFERNGKLYRPAQDSGRRYGHKIRIQEIITLSDFEYEEKTVEIIHPDESQGVLGTHTLNFSDSWIFSDNFYRK